MIACFTPIVIGLIRRTFYCFMVGKNVTVPHTFIKTTQQTPDRELKLARKRLKELQDD